MTNEEEIRIVKQENEEMKKKLVEHHPVMYLTITQKPLLDFFLQ